MRLFICLCPLVTLFLILNRFWKIMEACRRPRYLNTSRAGEKRRKLEVSGLSPRLVEPIQTSVDELKCTKDRKKYRFVKNYLPIVLFSNSFHPPREHAQHRNSNNFYFDDVMKRCYIFWLEIRKLYGKMLS